MDESYKFLFASNFVVGSYWIQEIFMTVDADLNCSPALDLRPLSAPFLFCTSGFSQSSWLDFPLLHL